MNSVRHLVSSIAFLAVPLMLLIGPLCAVDHPYQYFRTGNPNDVQTKTQAGFALMGGGDDLDEAFKWMCQRAGGGDFVVLRASGDEDYNPYIQGLCKLNSVATLILTSRDAAKDPFVAETIRHAEAVFIAGGDQAHYINWWMDTPVQQALNEAIQRGVPIGGTSAGLAVQGEFVYSAQGDAPDDKDLNSPQTLANPFHPRVTIVHAFLKTPLLKNTITDTHFAARDRMGRSLVFMARILQDGRAREVRDIAVDERTSVLLDPDGGSIVVGAGHAYFMASTKAPNVCKAGAPLTFRGIAVRSLAAGEHFDVAHWGSTEGTSYTLSVEGGVVKSSLPDGAIYTKGEK
ncbi:MAG TPA: cyanophycinase [Terriglobales bacterium]|nr:cyanophycinase [Terriglobales bacterium]